MPADSAPERRRPVSTREAEGGGGPPRRPAARLLRLVGLGRSLGLPSAFEFGLVLRSTPSSSYPPRRHSLCCHHCLLLLRYLLNKPLPLPPPPPGRPRSPPSRHGGREARDARGPFPLLWPCGRSGEDLTMVSSAAEEVVAAGLPRNKSAGPFGSGLSILCRRRPRFVTCPRGQRLQS